MRFFLTTMILVVTVKLCAAQKVENINGYDNFYKSFATQITYPAYLINNCIASAGSIKVEVNAKGNIQSMQLSDSVDSLLRDDFDRHKSNLDTTSFKRYIKSTYGKVENSVYLIPLFYSLYQMGCSPATIIFEKLKVYYRFGNQELNGAVIILKPFEYKIKVQR